MTSRSSRRPLPHYETAWCRLEHGDTTCVASLSVRRTAQRVQTGSMTASIEHH
jgi:hypothetical protein